MLPNRRVHSENVFLPREVRYVVEHFLVVNFLVIFFLIPVFVLLVGAFGVFFRSFSSLSYVFTHFFIITSSYFCLFVVL